MGHGSHILCAQQLSYTESSKTSSCSSVSSGSTAASAVAVVVALAAAEWYYGGICMAVLLSWS